MRTRIGVVMGIAWAALLGACHGPPLMSRIQPRLPPPAVARAPRTPAVLDTPAYLTREGRPESLVTDTMIDAIERAVRLRQEARRPPPDPCSRVIERARRAKDEPRVGREERGALPLPVLPLLRLLGQALAK